MLTPSIFRVVAVILTSHSSWSGSVGSKLDERACDKAKVQTELLQAQLAIGNLNRPKRSTSVTGGVGGRQLLGKPHFGTLIGQPGQ